MTETAFGKKLKGYSKLAPKGLRVKRPADSNIKEVYFSLVLLPLFKP